MYQNLRQSFVGKYIALVTLLGMSGSLRLKNEAGKLNNLEQPQTALFEQAPVEFPKSESLESSAVSVGSDVKRLKEIMSGSPQENPIEFALKMREFSLDVSFLYRNCYPLFAMHKDEILKVAEDAAVFYKTKLADSKNPRQPIYTANIESVVTAIKYMHANELKLDRSAIIKAIIYSDILKTPPEVLQEQAVRQKNEGHRVHTQVPAILR